MRRREQLAAVVLAWLTVAGMATAQANPLLDKAKKQIDDLYFEEAVTTLREALVAGTSDPAMTAEIHRLLGEVTATLGKNKDAKDHFAAFLSIDPDGKLGGGLSPKITRPFEAARDQLAGKSIAIKHAIKKQDPPTILLVVAEDPLGLVAGASARVWTSAGESKPVRAEGKKEIALELPAGTTRAVLYASDTYGNRLAVIGTDQDPILFEGAGSGEETADVDLGDPDDPDEDTDGKAFRSYWILTGGLTVGLATLGTVAGLSARSNIDEIETMIANSEAIEFGRDVKPLEDKARRDALIANISFAAAGVAAVATVVLFVTSRDKPSKERSAVIVPTASLDAFGVAAALDF